MIDSSIISSAVYPKVHSAPKFQSVMILFKSVPIIASSLNHGPNQIALTVVNECPFLIITIFKKLAIARINTSPVKKTTWSFSEGHSADWQKAPYWRKETRLAGLGSSCTASSKFPAAVWLGVKREGAEVRGNYYCGCAGGVPGVPGGRGITGAVRLRNSSVTNWLGIDQVNGIKASDAAERIWN
jgi:hypothetical protein